MNYYEILKVSKNATDKQIKASYKSLIKKYHPDIYKGDKAFAEKITSELNDAYDTLSVPEKRAEYDLSISSQPITPENNFYQNYSNYKRNYQTHNAEPKKETWDQKLRKKIYDYVDKHTKNLGSKKKVLIILGIIFLALFVALITIIDYLNFINR